MKKIIMILALLVVLFSIIPTNIAFAKSVKTFARILSDDENHVKECMDQEKDNSDYEDENGCKTKV